MKRIVVVLGVAAVMMALIACPGGARAERAREQFGPETVVATTVNECNGELVTVTGEATGFIQAVTTPSGRIALKIHSLFIGEGVSDLGNMYVFHAVSDEISHSDDNNAGPAT